MSRICNAGAQTLAVKLGITCDESHPFVYLHNPFTLQHWSMAVADLLFIGLMLFTLIHALHWRREQPHYLAVWATAAVYLLILEPPMYFPEAFGLGAHLPMTFMHNEFSIGFMYSRLPLYIVGLYVALLYFSYLSVERLGIFERCGTWLGAITVAFIHEIFYEIFDHYGPQFGWWAWSEQPVVRPALGSVPLSSLAGFAMMGPLGFAVAVRLTLVGANSLRSPLVATGRVIAAGALTTILVMLLSALISSPLMAAEQGGWVPQARVLILCVVALFAVIAVITLASVRVAPKAVGQAFGSLFASIYLGAFAALWIYAIPEHLAAQNGLTMRGTPKGSLWYVLLCFAFAITICLWTYRRSQKQTLHVPSV